MSELDKKAKKQSLRELVDTFPPLPGVYQMKDKKGFIIYIGKAKSLSSRVKTYLSGGDGRPQLGALMDRVVSIETIVCATEAQAAILERDLIVRHQPRYNIRLKDDKSFLHIRVDRTHQWPRIELVRRPVDDGAEYFGPYNFSHEIRRVYEVIRHVFPLRTCSDSVLTNRSRPCLEFQIKRCVAPCVLSVDRDQYFRWVQDAIAVLKGRTGTILEDLAEREELAVKELRFEEAAMIRDRRDALTKFSKGEQVEFHRGDHRDVWAIYREGSNVCVNMLAIRHGRINDNSSFILDDVQVSDESVLEEALCQFYDEGREIPDEIIVPFTLENESMVADLIRSRRGKISQIISPKQGSKARLLGLSDLNAKQFFSSAVKGEYRYLQAARKLAEIMRLSHVPRRIECVDISNLQGTDVVGGLSVFFDGVPLRREYRRYLISQQDKQDDFASIFEVVTRRLQRGMESGELPDLLVIDGGAGQLAMALRARDNLRVQLDIISIAKVRQERSIGEIVGRKKPERLFAPWADESIPLDDHDEVTHLLASLRDEAHRHVITFHRNRRARRLGRSVLDSIPGVGPERRLRLMKEFGSIARMRNATTEEIARVGRMPQQVAWALRRAIHRDSSDKD
jgi:excinuclease ABC subunit C